MRFFRIRPLRDIRFMILARRHRQIGFSSGIKSDGISLCASFRRVDRLSGVRKMLCFILTWMSDRIYSIAQGQRWILRRKTWNIFFSFCNSGVAKKNLLSFQLFRDKSCKTCICARTFPSASLMVTVSITSSRMPGALPSTRSERPCFVESDAASRFIKQLLSTLLDGWIVLPLLLTCGENRVFVLKTLHRAVMTKCRHYTVNSKVTPDVLLFD